jgi:hypothetical protein
MEVAGDSQPSTGLDADDEDEQLPQVPTSTFLLTHTLTPAPLIPNNYW